LSREQAHKIHDFTELMKQSDDRDIDTVFDWLHAHYAKLDQFNINTQNKDGSTLLHLCVYRPPSFYQSAVTQCFAKPLALEFLLNLGADLNMKNHQDEMPVSTAVMQYNKLLDYKKILQKKCTAFNNRELPLLKGTEQAIHSFNILIEQLSGIIIEQRRIRKISPTNKE
jgi:ankyrin repeat protein